MVQVRGNIIVVGGSVDSEEVGVGPVAIEGLGGMEKLVKGVEVGVVGVEEVVVPPLIPIPTSG